MQEIYHAYSECIHMGMFHSQQTCCGKCLAPGRYLYRALDEGLTKKPFHLFK